MAIEINNNQEKPKKMEVPQMENQVNPNVFKEKKKAKKWPIILLVLIILVLVGGFVGYKIVFDTVSTEKFSKTHLVINNSDCFGVLKHDVFVEDGVTYISTADMANFFDGEIYYDSKYNQVVTASDDELIALPIDNKSIEINSNKKNIKKPAIKKGENYFVPFSEIAEFFNAEVKYIADSNVVNITTNDKDLIKGTVNSSATVKNASKLFSKASDKVEKGEEVTIASVDGENDYYKVTTVRGKVGYLPKSAVDNVKVVKQAKTTTRPIDGKVVMFWDYFSEYASAPQRTGSIEGVNVVSPSFFFLQKEGNGNFYTNIEKGGEAYINWAHSQGYKVWALMSNNSLKETTSTILKDYKLREKLINGIIYVVSEYNLDGIDLDFENVYKEDKDNYTKLIMELKPRLKTLGKTLTVDVTAPDGSDDWSLCYDRNKIAKIADYIIFMGYDEYGSSANKAGTTSGYDWLIANLNKFMGQEGVPAEKLILGLPFYTRVWTENGESLSSSAIDMNATEKRIPAGVEKKWLDDEKQYYIEYADGSKVYKMWIEDLESMKYKLELANSYNLAGVSFWEKDKELDEVWQLIGQVLNDK